MRFARIARSLAILICIAAVALALTSYLRGRPSDVPWGDLALGEPIGRFTALKISRLHDDFPGCRGVLDNGGERYRTLPVIRGGPACGYDDGVRLVAEDAFRYSPAADVSCPVAVGLFLWERQVVQPAALRHFGARVAAIETYGSYSCRRIGGSREGRFSEHATADAIDIAAFRLDDGRRLTIAGDWTGRDDDAAFLRDVRDGACRIFATTLSPDYNAAHRDHLHLDQARRGGWTFCR